MTEMARVSAIASSVGAADANAWHKSKLN